MQYLEYSLLYMALAMFVGIIASGSIHALVNKKMPFVWFRGIRLNIQLLMDPLSIFLPAFCLSAVYPFLCLPPKLMIVLLHILQLTIIVSIGWAAKRFSALLRTAILERYDVAVADNLNARRIYTQIRLIEHVINFMIIIMTIAFMIMSFAEARAVGISIFASAGVVSIIIGFAAQKSLGNLLAGIQIAITQPIRLEDVVIVEKEWGWIEEITLTYVVVRTWDLRRLILPISYFIETPFQNWTRVSANILSYIYIYTDYTVPVEAVRNEFTRILQNSVSWDKKVNVLQVTDWSAQGVQIRALASAADSSISWNLQCEVREKILEFLQKNYPHALPRTRINVANTEIPKN